MTRHAGRNRRACDQRTIVINRDSLICDRDDDLERPVRRMPGPALSSPIEAFWAGAGAYAAPGHVGPTRLRTAARTGTERVRCSAGTMQTASDRQHHRADRLHTRLRHSRCPTAELRGGLEVARSPGLEALLDANASALSPIPLSVAGFVTPGLPPTATGCACFVADPARFALRSAALGGILLAVDRPDMRRVSIEIRAPDPELLLVRIDPLPQLYGSRRIAADGSRP